MAGKLTFPCFFLLESYYTILTVRISIQLCMCVCVCALHKWMLDLLSRPDLLAIPTGTSSAAFAGCFPPGFSTPGASRGGVQVPDASAIHWRSCPRFPGEWSIGGAQGITIQGTEKESQILFFLSILRRLWSGLLTGRLRPAVQMGNGGSQPCTYLPRSQPVALSDTAWGLVTSSLYILNGHFKQLFPKWLWASKNHFYLCQI